MKKAIKILAVVAVLVIVLVVGLVVALFAGIDGLAKKGIEQGGTYALGVPTTVNSVDVGLTKGTFAMNGLKVADPQGFATPHFLALNDTNVALDLQSIQTDLIRDPSISLADLDVNIARDAKQANFQVILDNLKRLESGEKPPPSGDQPAKKFVIDQIDIRNIKVHVDTGIASQLTKLDVPIDQITLKDVGSGGKPVDAAELTSILIKAVLTAVAEKGKGIIPEDLLGDLQSQLAQLKSLESMGVQLSGDLQKATEQAKEKVEDVKKEAEKTIEDAKKGIEGLIPGRNKGG